MMSVVDAAPRVGSSSGGAGEDADPPRGARLAGFLALLTVLYGCQGLPFGFLRTAVPYELRQSGRSLTFISLTTLLYLPWLLKAFWAPLLDRWYSRRFGRRRSWILPLQLALVAALVVTAQLSGSGSLVPLMTGVVLIALISATQDVAVDGLAIDRLSPAHRGLGNGIQYSGYRVGMVLGGGLLLSLSAPGRLGWSGVLLLQAAVVLLVAAIVFAYREPPPPAPAAGEASPPGLVATFTSFVREPGAWGVLGFIALFKAGDALSAGIVTPFLRDSGLSRDEVGFLSAYVGSATSIIGAMTGGVLAWRLGRLRALRWLAGVHAIAAAAYGLVALVPMDPVLLEQHLDALRSGGEPLMSAATNPRWTWLVAATAAEHLSGGMATAALFTLMMDLSDPRDGGTQYTLQASVVVACQLGAGTVAGASADLLGVPTHFFLAAAVCLLPVFAVSGLARNALFRKRLPERYW